MATISRPTPSIPRKLFSGRMKTAAGNPDAKAPAPAPSAYTRSALPLAVTWFLLPAVLLVLAAKFGWGL